MKVRFTILCLILGSLNSCAIGNKSQYLGGVNFKPELVGNVDPLVVTVQDVRPYVLDGSKTESYVGTLRSIGGVPWPVKTQSGRPLAVDLGESIVTTLNANGIKAAQLQILPQSNDAEIIKQLPAVTKETSAKILQFVIKEWRNHSWFLTTFHYCADLQVKSSTSPLLLATTTECGEHELPSSDPQFADLSTAVGTVIGKLVNANQIKAALGNTPTQTAVIKNEAPIFEAEKQSKTFNKCTTQQILKMKELKFSDAQIANKCP